MNTYELIQQVKQHLDMSAEATEEVVTDIASFMRAQIAPHCVISRQGHAMYAEITGGRKASWTETSGTEVQRMKMIMTWAQAHGALTFEVLS